MQPSKSTLATAIAALMLAKKDDFMGGPTLGELADIDGAIAELAAMQQADSAAVVPVADDTVLGCIEALLEWPDIDPITRSTVRIWLDRAWNSAAPYGTGLGEYQPITGYIIMGFSGEILMVEAHFIGGLPLPDGVAVCKRVTVQQPPSTASAGQAVAMPDDIAGYVDELVNYFLQMHAALREKEGEPVDKESIADANKVRAWLKQCRPEEE